MNNALIRGSVGPCKSHDIEATKHQRGFDGIVSRLAIFGFTDHQRRRYANDTHARSRRRIDRNAGVALAVAFAHDHGGGYGGYHGGYGGYGGYHDGCE